MLFDEGIGNLKPNLTVKQSDYMDVEFKMSNALCMNYSLSHQMSITWVATRYGIEFLRETQFYG